MLALWSAANGSLVSARIGPRLGALLSDLGIPHLLRRIAAETPKERAQRRWS